MKMRRARTWASLESELDAKIRAVRAEYDQPQHANNVEDSSLTPAPSTAERKPLSEDNNNNNRNGVDSQHSDRNGSGDVSNSKLVARTPLSTTMIGPIMTGIHLVASPQLVHLLSLHALAEARGSCQSLITPSIIEGEFTSSTSLNHEGVVGLDDEWIVSSSWEKPNVWLRQGKSAIEADAASLNHWSQSLLCPESKPTTNERLVVIHPRRTDDNSDMDNMLVSEFQSMFELCGYGKLPLVHTFSYDVDVTSWDGTSRNVSTACEKWSQIRVGEEDDTTSEKRPFVLLLIWPNEGWSRVKSALAACAEWTTRRIVVHVVPEDLVLMNRRRKSRLIGLATGVYSMCVKGGAVVLPHPSPPLANSASTASILDDSVSQQPSATSTTIHKRVHIAITSSSDHRWLVFAWVSPTGENLACRALPFEVIQPQNGHSIERYVAKRNRILMNILRLVSEDMGCSHTDNNNNNISFVIITHNLPSNFVDVDHLRANSNLTTYLCSTSQLGVFQSTSIVDDGEDNSEIQRELDNLAFLSTVLESPARGPVRMVLLGTLAGPHRHQHHVSGNHFLPPMHLRCAALLAHYVDGLVPGSSLLFYYNNSDNENGGMSYELDELL